MKFQITPEEAQPAAEAIAKYLQRKRMSVSVEVSAWQGAPLRTTLIGKKSALLTLVEVQGSLNYSRPIKELASWIAVKRHYAELSLGIPSDATTQVNVLEELQSDGIGLFVVDEDGSVRQSLKPKNPALVVTPDPTLKFGKCKQEVSEAVIKFNETNRKDGLRDMCELVERETESLAILSARKGLLVANENNVKGLDWASQINLLASVNAYNPGYIPIIEDKLKIDLHSFRGARNLIDHKARNKRDDQRRQMQFAERMMQGPRLVAELISMKRKVSKP